MRNSIGSETAKRVKLSDVLPVMRAGHGYSLVALSKLLHTSRGFLEGVLDTGVRSGKLEVRVVGAKSHDVFYLKGTAPELNKHVYGPNDALPITVFPASTVGTIDAYAAYLRGHRERAMAIRRAG